MAAGPSLEPRGDLNAMRDGLFVAAPPQIAKGNLSHPAKTRHTLQNFINQIKEHLDTKGLNFTVIDMTGLSFYQTQDILDYIASLTDAEKKRIILLGL